MVRCARAAVAMLAVTLLAGAACGDPVSKSDASATDEPTAPVATASVAAISPTADATRTLTTATPEPSATSPLPAPTPPDLTPTPASEPTSSPALSPTAATYDGPTRVTENFDTLPQLPWYNPRSGASTTVSDGGVLTLYAHAGEGNEVILGKASYPNFLPPAADVWDNNVSNSRGWWVEVRMRVDPLTDEQCTSDNMRGPALTVWATDDTQMLVRLGFSRSCVALVYAWNGAISMPMDTTSAFHTYRISTRLKHVKVYIDGAPAIEYDYGPAEETGTGLVFGDGQGGYGATRSYWDYITYDISGPSP